MTTDTRQHTAERIGAAFGALTRGPRIRLLHHVLNQRAGIELDRPAFIALAVLCDRGPLRVSELAEECAVDISTTSRLVARLTHDGLVRQDAAVGDRRVVMVEATDAGALLVR